MKEWFQSGCPRCLVVGEVAQAHDGSLGAAHAYIDAIAASGADAVKFQTHIAAEESTRREPWRVKFSEQDETRFDYWRRMEFTESQWVGLRKHAAERDLLFLSSPFSDAAVDLLDRIDVAAYKVASGEISTLPLLERVAATGRPILFSSGMSEWSELDAAVSVARNAHRPFAVLQCTTSYPCPPEKVGLNVLEEIRRRYDCPTGLSDHSATIYPGLAALTLGARILEVHVALSRHEFGPDVPASLTVEELADLARGIRFLERVFANPVDKEQQARELGDLRRTFGKSIVAARRLKAGTVLTASDLALKKPGTGLPPTRLPDLLGRRLDSDVEPDEEIPEDASPE